MCLHLHLTNTPRGTTSTLYTINPPPLIPLATIFDKETQHLSLHQIPLSIEITTTKTNSLLLLPLSPLVFFLPLSLHGSVNKYLIFQTFTVSPCINEEHRDTMFYMENPETEKTMGVHKLQSAHEDMQGMQWKPSGGWLSLTLSYAIWIYRSLT